MLKRRVTLLSILTVVLTVLAFSQYGFAKDNFVSYVNARFHFSFMRPITFTALEEPANGDGQIFVSEHLQMKIIGSGSYNILEQSALDAAAMSVPKGVVYKKLNCKKNTESDVCITWKDQGFIYLVRVIRAQAISKQDSERLLSVYIKYPQKNETKCQEYAKQAIDSLHSTL